MGREVVHVGKLSVGKGNLVWDRATHTVPDFQNQLFVRK